MRKLEGNNSGLAFLRFHMSVGSRLALRTFIPIVTTIFALYYLLRPELFHAVIAALIQSNFLITGVFSTLICLSIAKIAAPRVCLGLNGWIRHLPVGSTTNRRLAGFAIFIAQFPILAIIAALVIIACVQHRVSVAAYLVGLPLLGLASAQCVLPVKRRLISSPLTALACILVSSANFQFLPAGVILIFIGDVISGPLSLKKRHYRLLRAFKGSLLIVSIGWRALRLRLFLPWTLSSIIIGATSLFLSNNNFNPLLSLRALSFGGALSIIVFCASFANILASRRPPWPWIRSLPWSAKRRIAIDSLFLALHTIPLFITLGIMNIRIIFPLIASLPLLSLYASSAIRRAPESRWGASGRILVIGIPFALLLCLIPLASLGFLSMTLPALNKAAKEEQTQKVSRWLELHHLAAGDSLSWSE
ncbi:MAG: hypothetical protein ACETWK_14185 [Candidatus Aminicenantaceae bacterium]